MRGNQQNSRKTAAYIGVTRAWNSRNSTARRSAITVRPSFARQQRRDGECKIRKDHRVLRKSTVAQRALSFSREDRHRLRADRFAAGQVARTVADAGHTPHVDAEAPADLQQHAGSRLAAFALRIGAVGAKEDRVDASADLRERLV